MTSESDSNPVGVEPVFVFGTLRVGEALYELIEPAVVTAMTGGRTPGRLYYVQWEDICPGYPAAKFDDPEGAEVTGDILFCKESVWLDYVITMELNAGYGLEQVPVQGDNGMVYTCLAFSYEGQVGARVPYDDWKRRHAAA